MAALSLLLCASSVFAQSKQFICGGLEGASALGRVTVTVPTKSQTIGGEVHQMGTVVIGRVGTMLFTVTWDATAPSMAVTRSDGDGFEAAAIATGGEFVILRSKRPNEGEVQIGCSPR
jgi:hypothetical protein